MNQQIKPTPTEYQGTVYRSKSEAVFKRCLDLTGRYYSYYEPEGLYGMDVHPWDFWLDTQIDDHPWNGCEDFYIEYKPTKPTDTYISNLVSKVEGWPGLQKYEEECGNFNALIVYGSPWSPVQGDCVYCVIPVRAHGSMHGPRYRDWLGDKDGIGIFASWVLGITDEIAEQAKSYRFDLKH